MIKVLIPTDFSENATCAIDYAVNLYANKPCTFYLLHSTYMFNPDFRTHITPNYINELSKNGLKKLEELKLKYTNLNHVFEIILSKHKLIKSIKKAVKKNNIELVIMGTKGTTAAVELFAGSNTITVLKKMKNCSVLVVPNAYSFMEHKQIAFPTEYTRQYDKKELTPLKEIAQHYNAHINVLHISKDHELSKTQQNNKEVLKKHLINFKQSFHDLLDISKKSETIENFITEVNIDLLVMINYKHSFIENVLKEPVIKNLAFQPKIPLLITPKEIN